MKELNMLSLFLNKLTGKTTYLNANNESVDLT